jgi:hypothetical protein
MYILREKVLCGHSKRTATCKPRRETSEETKPVGTLNVHFQPLKMEENGYFVMAAQKN